jgi:hypothetical protein
MIGHPIYGRDQVVERHWVAGALAFWRRKTFPAMDTPRPIE